MQLHRSRLRFHVRAAVLVACAAACASQAFAQHSDRERFVYRDDDDPFSRHDNWWQDGPSREWLSVGFGFLDRVSETSDPVDDAPCFALTGGFELTRDPWRPSIEMGFTYSPHDVNLPDADTLDLWRVTIGARLAWHTRSIVRPYARAGFFWRWNTDDEYEDEPLDQTGRGWYAGLGFDFLYRTGLALGPSYTYFRGASEDDLEEHAFVLNATFRL